MDAKHISAVTIIRPESEFALQAVRDLVLDKMVQVELNVDVAREIGRLIEERARELERKDKEVQLEVQRRVAESQIEHDLEQERRKSSS